MTITIETVRLFGELTRGRFDTWTLAGDSRRFDRVRLMAAIQGVPKVPIARAGVNEIRRELDMRLDAQGECIAAREDDVRAKCREILNGKLEPAICSARFDRA